MKSKNIFLNPVGSVLICLLVCLLWGSLFPTIKVGYEAFKISSEDIPTIILFAGLRFFISGIILILISGIQHKKFVYPEKANIKNVLLGALFTIILHYGLTYMGLSLGEGSKSAIIKQTGFLFLSCFAFLFDKSDKWSADKTLAGIIGFCGIIVTSADGTGFTFKIGDALLVASSFCSVFGSVVSKKTVKTMSPMLFVAYSQFIGGTALSIAGVLLGGRISHIEPISVLVFSYICIASIGAYLLWNILLKYNSLSKLSIIKFSEPLFAVVLSGIILGESIFKISYMIALILILMSIVIENVRGKVR